MTTPPAAKNNNTSKRQMQSAVMRLVLEREFVCGVE